MGAGSHYVALAGLELPMQTWLTLNSERLACLCLSSAGTKGVSSLSIYLYVQRIHVFFSVNFSYFCPSFSNGTAIVFLLVWKSYSYIKEVS